MKTVEVQDVLIRLNETVEELPDLAEIIELQRELLENNLQVRTAELRMVISRENVDECLATGTPLLRRNPPDLDWVAFSNFYVQVCHIASRHRPELSSHFETLAGLVSDEPFRAKEMASLYLNGSSRLLGIGANGRGRDSRSELEDLDRFVLLHSLKPHLRACTAVLAPMIDERKWQRGICPICGSEPDLSYLEARTRNRRLVCPCCEFTWLFPRIKCPFCLTSESSDLEYFPSEDKKYRLYVCHHCKRYLKAVDLSEAGSKVMLPVERIITLPMDFAAQEYGYL